MATSQRLVTAQAVTGATNFFPDIRTFEFITGSFQVAFTGSGAATVTLEGRSDSNAPWVVLNTYTQATLSPVDFVNWLPQMRVNVTAISGGETVDAWAVYTPSN